MVFQTAAEGGHDGVADSGVCFSHIMEPDFFCTSEPDIAGSLTGWFGELPGTLLLEQERVVLERMLPQLKAQGVRLLPVSELIAEQQKRRVRLWQASLSPSPGDLKSSRQ